ncbi:glutamine amidotransferase of anthranilate synthase [Nitritalea halalkaliphila LW7]|uniref:Glutamine amidotransferase of anthranilate synthase n=1 Tax=Nitritalea halalkaliphila LW7 TaxID=1189621 RepID=I5BWD6_9BACT|nr:aminodeoxychorismate/anthranilate synthase component II [Nitritalea halalkaliphila]EIM73888.1 glutamine amidotransferase of anthranilate synthase [Nitritalea halalkaliphila LW7]
MLLLIDNFDSFSHMLADYVGRLGHPMRIVRNDAAVSEQPWEEIIGVVLSPGPGTPESSGNLLAYVGEALERQLPLLGICLGHQAIAQYVGARIVAGEHPVHGKVHKVFANLQHNVLLGVPSSFSVTRYHSLVVQDLPEVLLPLLRTEEGVLMGFVHRSLPVLGLQYHPEACMTEFGMEIIENWSKWLVSASPSKVSNSESLIIK